MLSIIVWYIYACLCLSHVLQWQFGCYLETLLKFLFGGATANARLAFRSTYCYPGEEQADHEGNWRPMWWGSGLDLQSSEDGVSVREVDYAYRRRRATTSATPLGSTLTDVARRHVQRRWSSARRRWYGPVAACFLGRRTHSLLFGRPPVRALVVVVGGRVAKLSCTLCLLLAG